jgi:hypothetical protein
MIYVPTLTKKKKNINKHNKKEAIKCIMVLILKIEIRWCIISSNFEKRIRKKQFLSVINVL